MDTLGTSWQGEAEEVSFEGHLNRSIQFLHVADKPGEVRNGEPYEIAKPNVNVLERWGCKPGREGIQKCTATVKVKAC
jgi:hypothetical protein